ncbi:Protein max [Aphelenchoides besseyi]|nr:Protein max [Aphelenchoides besseyi]
MRIETFAVAVLIRVPRTFVVSQIVFSLRICKLVHFYSHALRTSFDSLRSEMSPSTSPTSNNSGRKRRYSDDLSDDECSSPKSSPVDDDKRAHHNELERRRRDHIKDYFLNLKSNVKLLDGEKASRALILKRAVDYINMLQNQTKEYKTEIEELKRRNELLVQQASGLHLKPFLTSLQLQNAAASSQPLFSQTAPAASGFNFVPTTSAMPSVVVPQSSGDLTQFAPTGFSRSTPASPQALHTTTSTVQNNPALLANISSLLLQNPGLLNQLQQTATTVTNQHQNLEPLTPPYSTELADAQARLLASSLAYRERQFATAIGASQNH